MPFMQFHMHQGSTEHDARIAWDVYEQRLTMERMSYVCGCTYIRVTCMVYMGLRSQGRLSGASSGRAMSFAVEVGGGGQSVPTTR